MSEIIDPNEREHLVLKYGEQIKNIVGYNDLSPEEQRDLRYDPRKDVSVGLDKIFCHNVYNREDGNFAIEQSGDDTLFIAYVLSVLGLRDGRALLKSYERMAPANQGVDLKQLKVESETIDHSVVEHFLEEFEKSRMDLTAEFDDGMDLENSTRSEDIKQYLRGLIISGSCLKHCEILLPFFSPEQTAQVEEIIGTVIEMRKKRNDDFAKKINNEAKERRIAGLVNKIDVIDN